MPDFLRFMSLVAFIVCIFPPTAVLGALRCDDHCSSGCTKYGAGHCDLYCEPRATWRLRIFDHTCQPRCGGNCLYCRSLYYCDVCWKGYQLVTNALGQRLCKMLPPVCDVNCLNPKNCQLNGECNGPCKTGYNLVSKHCIPVCDVNCAPGATACSSFGPRHCDANCKANYYLLTSVHVCFGCDPNCTPATPGSCALIGMGTCSGSCIGGYTLNTITSTCDQCLSTCATCTDTTGCGTCAPNTVGMPTCDACDANCLSGCLTAGYCDAVATPTCAAGYGFTSTSPKKCGACDTYCATSGCNAQGAGHCDTACIPGYFLDTTSHTCAACQVPDASKCLACSAPGTCTSCASGQPPDVSGYCA